MKLKSRFAEERPAAPVKAARVTAAPQAENVQMGDTQPASFASMSETLLRVDAEKIDSVLNLVGELIIAKSMLHQAINELTSVIPKNSLKMRFSDAMAFQARIMNDLQKS